MEQFNQIKQSLTEQIITTASGKYPENNYYYATVGLIGLQLVNYYSRFTLIRLSFFGIYPVLYLGVTNISLKKYNKTQVWPLSLIVSSLVVNAFFFNVVGYGSLIDNSRNHVQTDDSETTYESSKTF